MSLAALLLVKVSWYGSPTLTVPQVPLFSGNTGMEDLAVEEGWLLLLASVQLSKPVTPQGKAPPLRIGLWLSILLLVLGMFQEVKLSSAGRVICLFPENEIKAHPL